MHILMNTSNGDWDTQFCFWHNFFLPYKLQSSPAERTRVKLSHFCVFRHCSVGSQNQFCAGLLALRANPTVEIQKIVQLFTKFFNEMHMFAGKIP